MRERHSDEGGNRDENTVEHWRKYGQTGDAEAHDAKQNKGKDAVGEAAWTRQPTGDLLCQDKELDLSQGNRGCGDNFHRYRSEMAWREIAWQFWFQVCLPHEKFRILKEMVLCLLYPCITPRSLCNVPHIVDTYECVYFINKVFWSYCVYTLFTRYVIIIFKSCSKGGKIGFRERRLWLQPLPLTLHWKILVLWDDSA